MALTKSHHKLISFGWWSLGMVDPDGGDGGPISLGQLQNSHTYIPVNPTANRRQQIGGIYVMIYVF